MIVTNVVKYKYVVKVFGDKGWHRKGSQIDQFVVDAESVDAAKLQAEDKIPERLYRLYGEDFKYHIEVIPLKA